MIKADINGQEYYATLSSNKTKAYIYDLENDFPSYLGTFIIDSKDNIIEYCSIKNEYAVIGTLVREGRYTFIKNIISQLYNYIKTFLKKE